MGWRQLDPGGSRPLMVLFINDRTKTVIATELERTNMNWHLPIGAQLDEEGVSFRVWANDVQRVEVVILAHDGRELAHHELQRSKDGYFSGHVAGLKTGTRYMYSLDGDKLRPDPASGYQPEGVHGPSEVVDLPSRGATMPGRVCRWRKRSSTKFI